VLLASPPLEYRHRKTGSLPVQQASLVVVVADVGRGAIVERLFADFA
jgi:hypothetical protein